MGVALLLHFFNRKTHGFRTHKLPLLDVHNLTGLSSSDKQARLAAEKSRDLEHIDKLSCHGRFRIGMDVGHGGDIKMLAYTAEDIQGFFVAYSGKRISFAAIRFSIRAFKNIRYAQALTNFIDLSGNIEGHLFAFNGTGASQQKEVAGIGVF
jgi:hypothetical protein